MPLGWGREYLACGEDRNGECFPGQVLISPFHGVSG